MSFSHIIGQEKAVGMLLGMLRRRRIASAYLFCGEPGIGKKTAAINFAKALNCQRPAVEDQDPVPDGAGTQVDPSGTSPFDACDQCESCMKIGAGFHPDFLLVSPEERLIRIEEIRMITDALSYRPFEGKKKVAVIDHADTMNISAANAFLKTLEEPPEDSVIVLISSKPDLLPATIRSRCSRINFSPLSLESCRRVLRGNISESDLEPAARLSMGRPGLALSTDLMEERAWFLDLFKGMTNAEKDAWASREEMERWMEHALTLFRDLAVLAITGERSKLVDADLPEWLAPLNKSFDAKAIIYIYTELKLLRGLLMFNLNKSITWNYTASLLRKELIGS